METETLQQITDKLTSTWMVTSRGDVESWLLLSSGSGLWSGALYTSTKSVGITAITNITPVTTITNITPVTTNITTLLAWALMNGKLSEYEKRFWNIFEEKLFCRLLDRNFTVLIEFLASDQSMMSVWVTQVTIKVFYWKLNIRRILLCSLYPL